MQRPIINLILFFISMQANLKSLPMIISITLKMKLCLMMKFWWKKIREIERI